MRGKIFRWIAIVATLVFLTFLTSVMYNFFRPTLTIVVPNGYEGRICLVLSNVEENILTLDSNGIGYLNKETFDKKLATPILLDSDGDDVSDRCVGFSPSAFWARGTSSMTSTDSQNSQEIQFLSLEFVPEEKKGQKQYYSSDLTVLVDKTKLYIGQEE